VEEEHEQETNVVEENEGMETDQPAPNGGFFSFYTIKK
jgi:hypothetical protein